MKSLAISFDIIDHVKPTQVRWTRFSGHLFFNVKMDFTWKSKSLKVGHKNPNIYYSTFSILVLSQIIRIAFTYAVLNGIDVIANDIKNHNLNHPCLRNIISYVDQSLGYKIFQMWIWSSKNYIVENLVEPIFGSTWGDLWLV